MLQLLLEQNKERKSDSDAKFNIQNSIINNKFVELKSEIQEMNKCLENTNTIIRTSLNKLEQNIERMGVHVMNTNKNNKMCIRDSGSGNANNKANDFT